jgi:hypothetical protein
MRVPSILALSLICAGPTVAKECRMPDVPPNLRVHLPPECRDAARTGAVRPQHHDRLGADAGFVDLGGGTKIRLGGRARAEVGFRR